MRPSVSWQFLCVQNADGVPGPVTCAPTQPSQTGMVAFVFFPDAMGSQDTKHKNCIMSVSPKASGAMHRTPTNFRHGIQGGPIIHKVAPHFDAVLRALDEEVVFPRGCLVSFLLL